MDDSSPHVPQPVYSQPRPLSGIVKFLIISSVVIAAILAFGFSIKIALSGFTSGGSAKLSGAVTKLDEKTIDFGDSRSPDKIVVIPISGVIGGKGSYVTGDGMVHAIARKLRQATTDSSVKAVVISMNSPGGGLTASDIIYHEVQLLKEAGKSVVVAVDGLAASGGLYIAAPADYIIATPTSLIGSIGVIMNRFAVYDLMKKIGIRSEVIKSTEMKDVGSPFRMMTDREVQFFQNLLETFHNRFVSIIAEGRNLEISDVSEIANGLIYTSDEALDYKLIDGIAYFDAALEKALELAGMESAHFISYEEPMDFDRIMKLFDAKTSVGLDNISRLVGGKTGIGSNYPLIMAQWTGYIPAE
ncbi:MAG: signal peptide peptidase SppA [Candidatus Electryoneaceae bacterium]|nr:signal peptide peptidase SppA [Candidatus Electryoneaceae bacterium]